MGHQPISWPFMIGLQTVMAVMGHLDINDIMAIWPIMMGHNDIMGHLDNNVLQRAYNKPQATLEVKYSVFWTCLVPTSLCCVLRLCHSFNGCSCPFLLFQNQASLCSTHLWPWHTFQIF